MRTDWKRGGKQTSRRRKYSSTQACRVGIAVERKTVAANAVACCIKLQWSLRMAMRSHPVGLGISFICNAKEHSHYGILRVYINNLKVLIKRSWLYLTGYHDPLVKKRILMTLVRYTYVTNSVIWSLASC